eukprot:363490-Chlamydomonas_euryale.AAC.6
MEHNPLEVVRYLSATNQATTCRLLATSPPPAGSWPPGHHLQAPGHQATTRDVGVLPARNRTSAKQSAPECVQQRPDYRPV